LTDLVIIRYENGNKLMGRGEEWERKPSRGREMAERWPTENGYIRMNILRKR